MKKFCSIVSVVLFISISLPISAQEILLNLHYNSVLKSMYKEHSSAYNKNKKIVTDTLSLPFFDDFSKPAIYPDSNLWEDDYAFVNTGYNGYSGNSLLDLTKTHNPPTIGIITLDAIGADGNLYGYLQPNNPAVADTLTSLPINLNFLPSDSVYFSFQYQPTSVGNTPEENDSLILEFYSPQDSIWHKVWYALGSNDKTYRNVIKPITDTIYLKKGFKFRFKNYVTLGSNYEPSWLSNCDQWNLDFILLDTNRHSNDTIFKDLTFLYPIKSVLSNSLEAMPWKHFKATGTNLISSSISLIYRNIGPTFWSPNYLLRINDLSGSNPTYQSDNDFENAFPDSILFRPRPIFPYYSFNSTASDSVVFELKCFFDWGGGDSLMIKNYLQNDTSYFYQKFFNYYAYDDGSAEAGYGLSGEGAMNSKMAVKYKCYKKDTLRGVDIFFNNTMDNFTGSKYFYLNVWNNTGSVPGDTIRCQMGERPQFDGLNKFHMYKFSNPVVIDSGATYYVGLMQTTNDMLNIGFDRNRDVHENLYYSISGTWVQSSYSGALMMRPLFGGELPDIIYSEITMQDKPGFELYPNPASTSLKINLFNNFPSENSTITITDICGKFIYHEAFNTSIDIANFAPGIYFITVTSSDKTSQTKKFIISR